MWFVPFSRGFVIYHFFIILAVVVAVEQLTVEYVLCSDLFVRAYKRAGDSRLEVASATNLGDVKIGPLNRNCL